MASAPIDLSRYAMPSNIEDTFSVAELNDTILTECDLISGYTVEKAVAAKDYMAKLHRTLQADPDMVHILTDKAIMGYYKQLESMSNLSLEELSSAAFSKPKTPRTTTKKEQARVGAVKLKASGGLNVLKGLGKKK